MEQITGNLMPIDNTGTSTDEVSSRMTPMMQ